MIIRYYMLLRITQNASLDLCNLTNQAYLASIFINVLYVFIAICFPLMSPPKLVLLSSLSKSFFGFFLSVGFLSGRFASMFELSSSSSFRATQAVVCSMLIRCEIVLAYKTREEDLRDLYS
jgi:hypothetical protein